MMFRASKAKVLNRGVPPDSFLTTMVEWARVADNEIFAPNDVQDGHDIYNKVKPELGPYQDLMHRKAVMLEVMRVLAGFESSWNWTEGVDTSRVGVDTNENSEAGAWQVSYDSRLGDGALRAILSANDITNGKEFQKAMKGVVNSGGGIVDHALAMDYVATLMRHNTKHNGPLYKGEERNAIRANLRGPEHSIYPWLSRAAVDEFRVLVT